MADGRVYDVTQVTYEIIIGFRDLRASRRCAAALARRWLAFHITFATFAARTRLFSTCTPQTHPPLPLDTGAFSFIFPFIYRISTIARATACYLLFAGTFVSFSDHRPLFFAYTHLRRMTKRARDDAAFLSLPAHSHCVLIKARRTRVSCRVARNHQKTASGSSSRGTTTSSPFATRRHRREPNNPLLLSSLQIKVLRGSISSKGNRKDPWSQIPAYISFKCA